ncbi:MAG: sigma-70 family RNA polymerase sigma factor [Planctomycetaceae bacterium]|nr:sigma-70 family RNA polymerase sigma factor [Planctomycetaceae bacterium]
MTTLDERSDDERWTQLIEGLRRSDDDVLREFYDRYDGALHLIVRRRLSPAFLRRFDSDDVVQSTLRTFFRRVQTGDLEMQQGQRLWNLLCAIALTKLREKVRFHSRMQRAVQRECSLQRPSGAADLGSAPVVPACDPSTDVDFADAFEAILKSLDEKDRVLVDLRLQGRSNQEVADELGVSDRTVQRMLTRLAEKFESVLRGGN